MKKRIVSMLLVSAMALTVFTGCHNSSESTSTVDAEKTGYDVNAVVENFEFGELNDKEKEYVIEMGYFNCDHMVAAIIGEKTGLYEALDLNVNVTKSGETLSALTSGAMDVGYTGIWGAMAGVDDGAPFFISLSCFCGDPVIAAVDRVLLFVVQLFWTILPR